jgi:hypothetical protein
MQIIMINKNMSGEKEVIKGTTYDWGKRSDQGHNLPGTQDFQALG